MPKNMLLHPKVTMRSMVAGFTALGTMLAAQVVAVSPLASLPLLSGVRDHILWIVGALTTASGICLALAAVGRSISSFVDNNGAPPTPGQPAELPKAA